METEIHTPHELFIHDLRSILYLEQKLVRELENMAGETTNDDLRDVLLEHQEETVDQVTRIEKVFELIDLQPEEHAASDFKGLMQESKHLNQRVEEAELMNIALLNTARKVEYVEISTYESLLDLAERLDMDDDIIDLLSDSLDEEKDARENLRDMSERSWWNRIVDELIP